jgi:hypothetical protein
MDRAGQLRIELQLLLPLKVFVIGLRLLERRLLAAAATVAVAGCSGDNPHSPTTSGASQSAATSGASVLLPDALRRATLALAVSGTSEGAFTLAIPRFGTFTGRLSAHDLVATSINIAVSVKSGGVTRQLLVRGTMTPTARVAHLDLTIQPDIHTQLDTVVPVSAQARSAVAATVDAMSSDNMSALAGLMDPAGHAGVSTSQLASTLAGQHVHVTSLRTTGPGRLVWLTDGQPGWEQPVQGSAATPAGVSCSPRRYC